MICIEGDDDSPKTPVVHPNDVLDVEISPITHPFLLPPPPGCENRIPKSDGRQQRPACSTTKQKVKKYSKNGTGIGSSKKQGSSVKRGDPFLPSVFSDENPIADFTVKKNSRKKPSDCKCKGFGYNLSPSALLPEEMRQQWGVGVFSKQAQIKPVSGNNCTTPIIHNSQLACTPNQKDREYTTCSIYGLPRLANICSTSNFNLNPNHNNNNGTVTPVNLNINNNNMHNTQGVYCHVRCSRCMQDTCICDDMGQMHDGFRKPDCSEKRKPKSNLKGVISKGKENRMCSSMGIGSTITTTPIKRSGCYSSKDNSNIISTSNFPRSLSSPVHTPPSSFVYNSDTNIMGSMSPFHRSVSSSRYNCHPISKMPMVNKHLGYIENKHATLSWHNPNPPPLPPRRVIANISPAPIISAGSLDATAPPNFNTPRKQVISRNGTIPTTRRILPHDCSCDSCRQRSGLMSTMDTLGPSSEPPHGMPPYLLSSRSQKYPQMSRPQSMSTPSRYNPYHLPSYSYKSTLRDIYGSSDSYRRSSSPPYDFNETGALTPRSLFSITPLSANQDMSRDESTPASNVYLDRTGTPMTPPSSSILHDTNWMLDDITNLSVQETVDFFLNIKPPIIGSMPSPQSDTSSDLFSPSPSEHRCTSPGSVMGCGSSSSCFCSWGSQPSSEKPIANFGNRSFTSYSTGSDSNVGHFHPKSMLYSSLVSDLEDELRCAIENIPTS